jgi:crotonobetainyl-CoA:carnitine CoA-transferase CaiB-like acyl-CoA transferase
MFSRTSGTIRRGAPILGEHAREILAEIGLTEEQIERLRTGES